MTHVAHVRPWPTARERHGASVLLLLLAIFVYLTLGWTAGQPIGTPLLAIAGATALGAARIGVDERSYQQRRPGMRHALRRTGAAVGRLLRREIMFMDIPAAQPPQLFITIRELALELGRQPTWSPTESVLIREGIEAALLAFEAEVGRQIPNLPARAARRIDAIADGLDECAEQILLVTHAANDAVTARCSGDETERTKARGALNTAVQAALEPLRAAHRECGWLIHAADA